MTAGRIIVLNGTSSAGKSSIARALQDAMDEPYAHLLIEEFLPKLPERYLTGEHADGVRVERTDDGGQYVVSGPVAERMVAGFYAAVAAVAHAGNNVVVDTLLGDPFDARACAEQFRELDVLMVGVHCPLQLLEERERARGDRLQGLARGELTRVHTYASYDLEVDTSRSTPEECAQAIAQSLALAEPHTAIRQMWQRLTAPASGQTESNEA
jgi:chloramphenicol 3-O phosphotransferase